MAAVVLLALAAVVALALWVWRRRRTGDRELDLPFAHRPWPTEEASSPKLKKSIPQMPQPTSPLPERDNWETGYLINEEEQLLIEMPAWIHYRDAIGQESRRNIVVKRLVKMQEGGEAVLAFCEARRANRTFHLSRMLQFVDRRTGEVVADVSAHLWTAHRESPLGRVEQAFSVHLDEVNVLVFIARADGTIRQKQRDIIANYFQEIEPSLIGCDVELSAAISAPRPDQTEYRKHVRFLKSRSAADRAALLAVAESLAVTRTAKREFTDGALSVVRKALAPPLAPKVKRAKTTTPIDTKEI